MNREVVIALMWLQNNWSFLVVIACVVCVGFVWVKKFANLPSEEQLNKIREWLLYAVIIAERDYEGGTGALKLRSVYDDFCKVFPSMVSMISFELFSRLVDEALVEMRHLLETNKDIEFYVKG